MKHIFKQQHIQLFLIYHTAHVCICNVFPNCIYDRFTKAVLTTNKTWYFLFDVKMLTNNKLSLIMTNIKYNKNMEIEILRIFG